MIIGVPHLTHRNEHRVGLTPSIVAQFTKRGHTVVLEKSAGLSARFTDRDYELAGAQVVYTADEAYMRADLVCQVSVISPEQLAHMKPGTTVCGFLHLAVASKDMVARLADLKATLIGYEIIRDERGELPVLLPMSEMAGQMAIHIAAHCLQNRSGGRGVLLGNVTGVPPPTVLVLGAGAVGHTAARTALALGAHVVILDQDYRKLRSLNGEFAGQIVTVLAATERLERYLPIADVVIGAVLIPGARAPFIITEAMVRSMRPGSVIVDISIDQGGCVETSRPTTLEHPTFVAHDVVHYCVPNLTANVARTASRALANAAVPYLSALTDEGIEGALKDDPRLAAGVYMYKGRMVHRGVGEALGIQATPLDELL